MVLPDHVSFDSGAIVVVSIFLVSLGGVISLLFKLYVKSKEEVIDEQREAIDRLNRHLEQAKDQSGATTGELIKTLAGVATDSKVSSQTMIDSIKRLGETLDRVDKHIEETGEHSTREHEKLLERVEKALQWNGHERRRQE